MHTTPVDNMPNPQSQINTVLGKIKRKESIFSHVSQPSAHS